MGSGRDVGPSRQERLGRSLVGSDSPAARCRLVHRATHDRMAEAEPSRHVGRADDVAREQLVDGLHRLLLADVGGRCRHLGLEGIARRPTRPRARAGRAGESSASSSVNAASTSGGTWTPSTETCGRAGEPVSQFRRPGELLEIERISPGFLEERCRPLVGVDSPEHRSGFLAGERVELEPGEAAAL